MNAVEWRVHRAKRIFFIEPPFAIRPRFEAQFASVHADVCDWDYVDDDSAVDVARVLRQNDELSHVTTPRRLAAVPGVPLAAFAAGIDREMHGDIAERKRVHLRHLADEKRKRDLQRSASKASARGIRRFLRREWARGEWLSAGEGPGEIEVLVLAHGDVEGLATLPPILTARRAAERWKREASADRKRAAS